MPKSLLKVDWSSVSEILRTPRNLILLLPLEKYRRGNFLEETPEFKFEGWDWYCNIYVGVKTF